MKKSNPSNMKSTLFLTCCLFWSAALAVSAQTTTNHHLEVTGDLLVHGSSDLGPIQIGPDVNVRYYPNVVSKYFASQVTGSLIIETPIPRTSQHTFSIRVRGYNWHHNRQLNVAIDGVLDAGNGPDGQPGHIARRMFIDSGNDNFEKYVGISTNGNVVIALGDDSPVRYHDLAHYTVDATIAKGNGSSDPVQYDTGWSISIQPGTASASWPQKLDQYPFRGYQASVFGVGNSVPGQYGHAFGYQNSVSGYYAAAQGYQSSAVGNYSMARGRSCVANGSFATAIGYYAETGANYAFAVGPYAEANNYTSLAIGYYAKSDASYAVALGSKCEANDLYGLALGRNAKANHDGALVLADSGASAFASTVDNEFAVRASGGARFVTSGAGLTVDGPIQASTGGVTFGDATVQTTAAHTTAEIQAMIDAGISAGLNNVQPQGGISMGLFQ